MKEEEGILVSARLTAASRATVWLVSAGRQNHPRTWHLTLGYNWEQLVSNSGDTRHAACPISCPEPDGAGLGLRDWGAEPALLHQEVVQAPDQGAFLWRFSRQKTQGPTQSSQEGLYISPAWEGCRNPQEELEMLLSLLLPGPHWQTN